MAEADDQHFAFGSAEEGRSWVGRTIGPRPCEIEPSRDLIRNYCGMVEDGNPRYWEHDEVPPGLLLTLAMPLPWQPGGGEPRPSIGALQVPLPGHHIINVSTDTEVHEPIRAGDEIQVQEEIVDVSPEKSTRLGRGHFVTSKLSFLGADGRVLATVTNVIYRYEREEDQA